MFLFLCGYSQVFFFENFTIKPSLNQTFDIHSSLNQWNRKVFGLYKIHHGRNGENRIKPIFTKKPFLDDIHMEHTKKSATKTKSKCLTILHLVDNCTIIERKLLKTIFEFVVFSRINRINPSIYIRRHLSKSRNQILMIFAGSFVFIDLGFDDSISNFHISYRFLSSHNIADLPFGERVICNIFWSKMSDFCWLKTFFWMD